MTAVPHTTHPIHLAPLHPSSLSTKPSQEDVNGPNRTARARWTIPTWQQAETALWASLPMVLHVVGLALLLFAFFERSKPYLMVRQARGSGLIDFGILGEFRLQRLKMQRTDKATPSSGSCSVAPDTTERICTSPSLNVNFLPSILHVSQAVPGFAPLKLPLQSSQTPAIVLSAIVLLTVSLLVFIPLWTLAWFPDAPLPAPLVKYIRFRARQLFLVAGVLSFASMILTLTIGLGYKLLLSAAAFDFNQWITFALFQGQIREGATRWTAELGGGFDILWASTVCQALVTLGIKVALHNSQDERVEWPKDTKVYSDWA